MYAFLLSNQACSTLVDVNRRERRGHRRQAISGEMTDVVFRMLKLASHRN
jgi:hypothetical protein